MLNTLLSSLLCLLVPLLGLVLPATALDTSAGVGLQDRALFQETVDYTLTNQTNGDFEGQNLANTSLLEPWAAERISEARTCMGRSSPRGPSPKRISRR